MTEPKVLIIRLLEACNAGCFMCGFAFSEDKFRFGLDDLKSLITHLPDSIQVIRFTGGEPLMMESLPLMISAIKTSNRKSSIITNGWWLAEKVKDISEQGLNQVITSIDGPDSRSHDRFRRLPGLFDRLVRGLEFAKRHAPDIRLRVNTVIGPHNISVLPDMWHLLQDLKVDQWSLIPLKRAEKSWGGLSQKDVDTATQILHSFMQQYQTGAPDQHFPAFVGNSHTPFGRNRSEQDRFLKEGRNIAPTKMCQLVDQVRYFTPKDQRVYPCNCLPHRGEDGDFFELAKDETFTEKGLVRVRNWLREKGPEVCKGCEPANAALGDGNIDLDEDVFGF